MEESHSFPEDFVSEFMNLGLGGILIPKEWGGSGKGVREASLILRGINAMGGNAHQYSFSRNDIFRGQSIPTLIFRSL